MKKKKIAFVSIIILFLIIVLAIKHHMSSHVPNKWAVPPMVMVDNNLYQIEDSDDYKDSGISPTGTIKDITDNKIPTENEQANFGEVGMEYWLTDDDQYPLKVKLNDKILKFEYIEIDENGNAKYFD